MIPEPESSKPTETPTGWRVSYLIDPPFVVLQPQKPKHEDFATHADATARAAQLRASGFVASVTPAVVKRTRQTKGRATGRGGQHKA